MACLSVGLFRTSRMGVLQVSVPVLILALLLSACGVDPVTQLPVTDPVEESPVTDPVDESPVTDPVDESTELAGYLDPTDFTGDVLTFELPVAPSGRSYLFMVPDLDTTAFWHRNEFINYELVEISVTTEAANVPQATTSFRPLPSMPELELRDWSVPKPDVLTSLPAIYNFTIWSEHGNAYVIVPGSLVFASQHYAFYEDDANVTNFSAAEYQDMAELLDEHAPTLFRLMGEPTDLDENGKIKVFISSTIMDHRDYGEAYFDGCHLAEVPYGCSGRGEYLYIAGLDHFGGLAADSEFFATSYHPGNILHETVHLLQYGHGYRDSAGKGYVNAPAFLIEGQAELSKLLTGVHAEDLWRGIAYQLYNPDQRYVSPWFQIYSMDALLSLFLHAIGGEGFSQALIESFHDSEASEHGLLAPVFGMPEPLLFAWMYAALQFDGTAFGEQVGLEFPGFDVISQLSYRPPVAVLPVPATRTSETSFTGAAQFVIEHDEPVTVRVETGSDRVYVLFAQP